MNIRGGASFDIRRLFRKPILFCKHEQDTFVRNIYGDEIIEYGYKRSVYRCNACGTYIYKDNLK